jgi:hypothetical protein
MEGLAFGGGALYGFCTGIVQLTLAGTSVSAGTPLFYNQRLFFGAASRP